MTFVGEMLEYAPWYQWLVNFVLLGLAIYFGGVVVIVAWCLGLQLGMTLMINIYVKNGKL